MVSWEVGLESFVQDVYYRLGVDCDSARFPNVFRSNLSASTYIDQGLLVPMLLRLLNHTFALCFGQKVVDSIGDGAFGVRQVDLVYCHVLRLMLGPVNLTLLDHFGVSKL